MEFDSTKKILQKKLSKFVLKTPHVKTNYILKTNRVQTSTCEYVIEAKKKMLDKDKYLSRIQYSNRSNYDQVQNKFERFMVRTQSR